MKNMTVKNMTMICVMSLNALARLVNNAGMSVQAYSVIWRRIGCDLGAYRRDILSKIELKLEKYLVYKHNVSADFWLFQAQNGLEEK